MTKKYITIAVAVISSLCLIGLFIFFAIEWKMAYEKQSRMNAEATSSASHQSQKDKEAAIEKPEETKPNQAKGSHHGVQLQARHMPWRVSTENKIFIDKRAVHHDSETHTNNNHG